MTHQPTWHNDGFDSIYLDEPSFSRSDHQHLPWPVGSNDRSKSGLSDYYDDMYVRNRGMSDPDRFKPNPRPPNVPHGKALGQYPHRATELEISHTSGPAEKSYHNEVPSSASHFTRHARRVYVGGIPTGHTQENEVKTFLNEVISNCLDEGHINSYVLSVYMNHKKHFAFIELSSVELTQACLELDGILYRGGVLKIQRANEYKPELLPTPPRPPVRFQARKAPFPSSLSDMEPLCPVTAGVPLSGCRSGSSSLPRSGVREITRGTLAVVGFPYDEGDRRSDITVGAASACRVTRHYLRKVLNRGDNPEYGIDITSVSIVDVGDVPLGLTLEEALSRLDDMVSGIAKRGGVPIVIGGSGDMSYACTAGLISVVEGSVGVVKVDSRLNVSNMRVENKIESASATRLLLSDTRFCHQRERNMADPNCEERLILYGLQGAYCTSADVRYVQSHGALLQWLNKDIRRVSPLCGLIYDNSAVAAVQSSLSSTSSVSEEEHMPYDCSSSSIPTDASSSPSRTGRGMSVLSTQELFAIQLASLYGGNKQCRVRSVHVSISAHSICDMAFPGKSCQGSDGFTAKEMLDICTAAGAAPNVSLLDLSGFNPDVEETRSGVLIAEMIYSFLLGYTFRGQSYQQSTCSMGQSASSVQSGQLLGRREEKS